MSHSAYDLLYDKCLQRAGKANNKWRYIALAFWILERKLNTPFEYEDLLCPDHQRA